MLDTERLLEGGGHLLERGVRVFGNLQYMSYDSSSF